MITTTNLRIRVARGIEWATTHPEYHINLDKVNLEILEMIHPRNCVLGQGYEGPPNPYGSSSGWRIIKDRLYGEFGGGDMAYQKVDKFLAAHGFDLEGHNDVRLDQRPHDWRRLTQVWKDALTERTAA
jgi:hypothetical protein